MGHLYIVLKLYGTSYFLKPYLTANERKTYVLLRIAKDRFFVETRTVNVFRGRDYAFLIQFPYHNIEIWEIITHFQKRMPVGSSRLIWSGCFVSMIFAEQQNIYPSIFPRQFYCQLPSCSVWHSNEALSLRTPSLPYKVIVVGHLQAFPTLFYAWLTTRNRRSSVC